MLDDGVLAVQHGFEVHGPGGPGEGRSFRLTRRAGDGPAGTLLLDRAHLSVAAEGLRDTAVQLPSAEVRPGDVRFPHAAPVDPSWPAPAVTVQLPPVGPPATGGRSFPVLLAVVAGIGLLLVVVGIAAGGISGGLVMAALVAGGVGLPAFLAGHARWALLAGRRAGTVVATAGLATIVVGCATVPARTGDGDTPAAAVSTSSETSSSTADPGTAAESDETSSEADVGSTGLLSDAASDQAVASAVRTSALAAVGALVVKGRAPKTGYSRDRFGSGWVDVDRNGCDTRNDILARDLTGETYEPGTRDCVVLTGSLADPYSATTIAFQRGQGTSDDVQIDHVVALSDAWQKGAQGLDPARRTAFANDPLNLLAVDGGLNMQKGDGDAATWLPPNRAFRCAYVARQVAVKVSYGLWVTPAERNAMATVLSTCPDEPLPAGVVANVPAPVPVPAPAPASAPGPSVSYADCAAVRAAGAGPLYAGQPGYSRSLDRDGDGVACET